MFLIRLQFQFGLSVADIIHYRYGDEILSKIRKLEKLDLRCRKTQLDITFLQLCLNKDIIPNFVQFRTANSKLGNSEAYITCQRLLLNQELDKKKFLRVLKNLRVI